LSAVVTTPAGKTRLEAASAPWLQDSTVISVDSA
jgi:hypothetical protein